MSSENFTYKGISAGKYVEGSIEAISQDEANFKLKQQKIIITSITKSKKKAAEKKKKSGGGLTLFKKKIKPEDVVIFSKQFATMVKAGLPILNTLSMLRDQIEHPTLKEIIEEIIEEELKEEFVEEEILEEKTVEASEEKKETKRDYRIEKINAVKEKIYAVAAKRKWLFLIIAAAIVAYLVIFKGGFSFGGGGGILEKIKSFF